MEQNIEDNQEEVGLAVLTLQMSWRYRDFVNAGKAYGTFWGILMGKPMLEGDMMEEEIEDQME